MEGGKLRRQPSLHLSAQKLERLGVAMARGGEEEAERTLTWSTPRLAHLRQHRLGLAQTARGVGARRDGCGFEGSVEEVVASGGGGGGEGLAVWEERCDEIAPPRRHLADCRRQEREMEARGPRRRRHRLLHLLCDGVRVELVRREPRGKFDGKKLVGGMCLRLLVASECMQ